MAYLVLARKYRPRRFEDVIGQEAIAETLKNAIETGRVAHAYLFSGQRGVGKTTMARVLAAALNCEKGPTTEPCGACPSCQTIARGEDLDVLEIDGASNTGVDNIRELRSNARYAPARSRFKIYYVDEVHMLSKSAFNALLKTLEEPPEHVKFIFSTTEPHRIPETIHSRCQRFDFRSIPAKAVADHLAAILKAEGIKGDAEVLTALARRSRGSLRDALSLLDQLLSATGAATDLAALERLLGLSDREEIEAMGRALADKDGAKALALVQRVVDEGRSLGEFLNLLVEHLREALLVGTCGRDTELVALSDASRAAAAELAQTLGTDGLLYAMQLLTETVRRMGRGTDDRLAAELAVVRLASVGPLVPLAELVDRLERLGGNGGGASRGGAGPFSGGPSPRGGEGPSRPAAGPEPPQRPVPRPPATPSPGPPPGPPPSAPPRRGASAGAEDDGRWDAAVAAIADDRRRIAAMLREGHLVSIEGDTVVVVFSTGHRPLVERLNEPETQALIRPHLLRAFGRQMQLQFIVSDPSMDNRAGRPGAPGGDGQSTGPAAEPEPALRERVLQDPAVKSALAMFGARLVRVERAAGGRPASDDPAPE